MSKQTASFNSKSRQPISSTFLSTATNPKRTICRQTSSQCTAWSRRAITEKWSSRSSAPTPKRSSWAASRAKPRTKSSTTPPHKPTARPKPTPTASTAFAATRRQLWPTTPSSRHVRTCQHRWPSRACSCRCWMTSWRPRGLIRQPSSVRLLFWRVSLCFKSIFVAGLPRGDSMRSRRAMRSVSSGKSKWVFVLNKNCFVFHKYSLFRIELN